ncbi:MAG TPA: HPr family phosphocarrier protein [Petrotogaceae bacterium]|jgi:phosphocarrier protein|nr:HPr family phosphocarrier protein [Petrotogaceae bacterium]HPG48240.1 HPr family phosphocarrier protein [Petrotogaceae bacterium]HQF32509.1 HPr family phosphocarrier protein [Petrotogaceae bacterium]HQH33325.1 HPr family phosphocarrier protein [Petrotogaceae bacterium]HQI79325.1 HPr family phosphocarrier protein [Petrotogaceae bacterium]
MKKTDILLQNETGLHARPASEFVKLAKSFEAKITLVKDGKEYNGKSILNVLGMGAGKGTKIELRAEGEDEETALEKLSELVKSFSE